MNQRPYPLLHISIGARHATHYTIFWITNVVFLINQFFCYCLKVKVVGNNNLILVYSYISKFKGLFCKDKKWKRLIFLNTYADVHYVHIW